MKKNIVSFSDFINPNGNLERFVNKSLDINSLDHCSYVRYFILEHINGEICGEHIVIDFDKNLLINCYLGPYLIYAINCLDNIVCEVI